MVCPVVAVFERNNDQFHSILHSTAHQRPAGRFSITCFQTDAAFVLAQQLIVIHHSAAADGDALGRHNARKRLILHRIGRQHRHVSRCGIMTFCIQTVWIGKGRMRKP